MPVYHPSAQVLLWIRVEELLAGAQLSRNLRQPPGEGTPSTIIDEQTQNFADNLTAISARIRELRATPVDSYPGGFQARQNELRRLTTQADTLVQGAVASEVVSRPPFLSGSSPDDRFIRAGILPRSVSIERNGFRTADTCSIELDYADVPFDPRLVRAAFVEVVVGSVSSEDFEAGFRGETNARGVSRSVAQQQPGGSVASTVTRFAGVVDEWDIDFNSDGFAVMVECRDLTALMSDTPLPTGVSIDLTKPLDEGVRDFLAQFPATRGLPVRFAVPAPSPIPVPAAAIPPQRRARRGRVVRQARTGDQKMKIWDHITDVCVAAGIIPIVKDYVLILEQPRTAFSQGNPSVLVYGRNISKLQFARKLGGVKVPTIEIRSYDPSIGRTRWARWPQAGNVTSGIIGVSDPPTSPQRVNDPGVSGAEPDEKIQTYVIRALSDPTQLTRVAQSTFEQIGRQEMQGNFETNDLTSWDSPVDFDLLRLSAGDAVAIWYAPTEPNRPQDTPSTIGVLAAQQVEARAAYLRSLGWPDESAQRFAEIQQSPALTPVFYVQNVRIEYDHDEGIKVAADFINYVVPEREQPGPSSDTASQTTQGAPSNVIDFTTELDRETSPAENLRKISATRQFLNTLMSGPTPLSPESYAEKMSVLDRREREARAALEASRA